VSGQAFRQSRDFVAHHFGATFACVARRQHNRVVEEYLITAVDYLRLVVEAIGAAIVGFGAISTAFRYALTLLGLRDDTNTEIRL
jgi:hypothetical protein